MIILSGIKYFFKGKKRLHLLNALENEEEYFNRNTSYAGKRIRSTDEIHHLIGEKLLSGSPFMAGRYGYTEMFVMRTFQFKMKWNYDKAMKQLCLWSGFFPEKISMGYRFTEMMRNAGRQVDILGVELEPFEDYYISHELKRELEISALSSLEPWKNPEAPWSALLKGKRVLIIHPFAETIEKQYKKRDKIFPGTEILPEFTLITQKAVQTIAGEKDSRFSDWFEALDYMYEEAIKKSFDIAIVGCGAYGFPLAAMLRQKGKQVIHLGGALQILFGIKGKRWDEQEKYSYVRAFYNDFWVYPEQQERPRQLEQVEGGCYW